MVSYILINEYSILLFIFINPMNFKFLQVRAVLFYTFPTASRSKRKEQNITALVRLSLTSNCDWQMTNVDLNFANVFLNKKRSENKKR